MKGFTSGAYSFAHGLKPYPLTTRTQPVLGAQNLIIVLDISDPNYYFTKGRVIDFINEQLKLEEAIIKEHFTFLR